MFEALLLGIVQGITEFIPVSSSGHLVIFHEIFSSNESSLAFDVALHAGTLLAVILYFRKDIIGIMQGVLSGKKQEQRLAWMLLVATIPAVITGLFLNEIIKESLRSPWVVVFMLVLFGAVMLYAEAVADKIKAKQGLSGLQQSSAIKIGFLQACALVPGVSRSGATISAGLLLGLERVAATRFSFLLAVPIICGAALRTFLDGGVQTEIAANQSEFIVGTLTAFISGLAAITFLIRFVSRYSIRSFAYYRFAAAGIISVILILNR